MRGGDDRLQTRAAQPVDRLPGDLDRQIGEQRPHAPDVSVVLARLVGRPEDHVIDDRRIERAARHQGTDDVGGHVIGPNVLQRAAIAAEGCSNAIDDDRGARRGLIH